LKLRPVVIRHERTSTRVRPAPLFSRTVYLPFCPFRIGSRTRCSAFKAAGIFPYNCEAPRKAKLCDDYTDREWHPWEGNRAYGSYMTAGLSIDRLPTSEKRMFGVHCEEEQRALRRPRLSREEPAFCLWARKTQNYESDPVHDGYPGRLIVPGQVMC
jgi:hypothetical protein